MNSIMYKEIHKTSSIIQIVFEAGKGSSIGQGVVSIDEIVVSASPCNDEKAV